MKFVRHAVVAYSIRQNTCTFIQTRINDYAASLPIERAIAPTLDPATHYLGEPRDTLAFFLTLDAINFGSGVFSTFSKRPGMSGYFTIASSLADHYRAARRDRACPAGQPLGGPMPHRVLAGHRRAGGS